MAAMRQTVVMVPVDGNRDAVETAVQTEVNTMAWQKWRLTSAVPVNQDGHTTAVLLFLEHTEQAAERPAA